MSDYVPTKHERESAEAREALWNALGRRPDELFAIASALTAAEERGRRRGDSEWLTAITRWQEHPRCSVTMEQMFYDARHPEDTYLSERCDGCDPVRLLLTRAISALAPRDSGKDTK